MTSANKDKTNSSSDQEGERGGKYFQSATASAAVNVEHDICGNLCFVFPAISLHIYCFQTYAEAKYYGMF